MFCFVLGRPPVRQAIVPARVLASRPSAASGGRLKPIAPLSPSDRRPSSALVAPLWCSDRLIGLAKAYPTCDPTFSVLVYTHIYIQHRRRDRAYTCFKWDMCSIVLSGYERYTRASLGED
jgi:hypothetical protein